MIQGKVQTQCVFYFFVKYATFIFISWCLLFSICSSEETVCTDLKSQIALAGLMFGVREANRLKLLLPVTAAHVSIHAQMMITSTVYTVGRFSSLFHK